MDTPAEIPVKVLHQSIDGVKRSRSGSLMPEHLRKSSSSGEIKRRATRHEPEPPQYHTPEISGSDLVQAFEKQFLRSRDDTTKTFTQEELNTLFSKETLRVVKKKKKPGIGSLFSKGSAEDETEETPADVSTRNWDQLDMAKKERRIRALLAKRQSMTLQMHKMIMESIPAPLTIADLKGDYDPNFPPMIWPDPEKGKDMWLELGDDLTTFETQMQLLHVEKRETEVLYYKEWFSNVDHVNFVANDKQLGPIVVSIERPKKEENKSVSRVNARVLVRSRDGDEWLFVSVRSKSKEMLSEFRALRPQYKNVSFVKIKKNSGIQSQLVELEERMAIKHTLAIGVLYVKAGQKDENEMFGNPTGSQAFEDFLLFLGEKIELNGWKGFAGGLDCSPETRTGKHAIYTEFDQFKFLFHVSTYLPYVENDEQQLERKRHLGNDVVNIIFLDSNANQQLTFDPTCLTTKFTHVFIVVSPDEDMTEATGTQYYKLGVACHNGVETFSPRIPGPASFPKNDSFRAFLLTKIINAQRAAMAAPGIKERMKRTKETFLQQIVKQALG